MDSKQEPLNAPPLSSLLAFLKSAELGSFAAAARHLDRSPAAVGQAVQRLEERFGARLFSRTTRRMQLTDEGRALADRSRVLVAELNEIGRLFDESRKVVAGPLRISAPLGFGRRQVVPLVARFQKAHPGLEVTLDLSDSMRDFAQSPLDLAFRILRPTDSAIIARPISRLQAVTVASPDYLSRRGRPRHPSELEGHDCVGYRHPATGDLAPMVFSVGGRDVTVAQRARLVVNDVDAGCDAAALGLGIAQPPSDYVRPYLASGRLVPILTRYRATPWTLYLCYPAARRLPFRVRAFIEFARDALGRDQFALTAATRP
jgi:DNA-binding transcriptional LysR family regulator